MIDVAVAISTLTVSSSSIGGFTSYIDTSSNSIAISSFTLNFGTFFARTSTLTIGGMTLSSGTYNAGGSINTLTSSLSISSATFNANTSSWTIAGNVNIKTNGETGAFNANASTITVMGNWTIGNNTTFKTATETLIFSGTSAQNVYSSSRTYWRVFVTNPAGINFQDTLTVSTFSMTTPNAVARLQVSPSSMTVIKHLELNGQATSSRTQLLSLLPGTQALLTLRSGMTQNVQNTLIQDSNASSGVTGIATAASNINGDNNVNWNFGARFWVAPSSGNWSDGANWSTVSGGAGGAGVPGALGHAIFDGNSLSNPTIDTVINISTLTISPAAGSGYTGIIDTSSRTVTISSFTQNFGTFYARTSSITIGNMLIASGTYNAGLSSVTVTGSLTMSSSTLNADISSWTVRGSVNLSASNNQFGVFNAGGSSMTVLGSWTIGPGLLYNTSTEILVFAGAAAQSVWSSSRTYFHVQVANTAGVTFQDSFTASTFTMTVANALAKFQTGSSSVTVTNYLNLNGPSVGSRVLLQSRVSGTRALLVLKSGLTQTVLNAGIKDSDASNGVTGDASDPSNVNSGNTTNWNFPGTRYWVAPASGTWSNAANWSGTSGGAGGYGAPTTFQHAIFDASGPGYCLINTPVAISTLTISPTVGSGYPGYLDTSTNTVTLSSFTLSNGTFYARNSSMTIRDMMISSGTYVAGSSSVTVATSLILGQGTFNANTSSWTIRGDVNLSASGEYGVYNAGGSTMTVLGNWTLGSNLLYNTGTETLAFRSASAQNVYSSSHAYFAIQVVNPAGVSFQDTLTVSSFTMVAASAMAKLQVAPSSMTVTSFFNVNGLATNTRAQLQSTSAATRALLVLSTGAVQSVRNTNIQDSDASAGIAGQASDPSNFNSGNNVHWNFTGTRYWVAAGPGLWSDSANWSASSGGGGGASAPTSGEQAIFDANGQGPCTMDTAVNLGAIILSTAVGVGYNEFLDTSSHTLTVNSFTQNYGAFYARTSNVTVGDMVLTSGTFNSNGSSLTVSGNWTKGDSANFTVGTSTVAFSGYTPSLTGSTTFYNFVYTVAGGTLTLPANSTQTISGLLRLAGNSSNQTLVRSSLSGTYAYFRNSGLNSISYVDAKDNNAAGGTVIVAGTASVNSGNLANWAFAFTVTPIDVNGSGGGLGDGSSVWGDFNNDGRLDLAVDGQGIGSVKRLRVFLNNGDDTFSKIEVASNTPFPTSLSAGDYNNDGFLDLAMNGYGPDGAAVYAYRNNGDNTFTLVDVAGPAGGLAFGNVAWGDFNNDGLLDLAASGQDAGGAKQIWVYQNNGNNTFTKVNVAASGTGAFQESIAWGDHNNDGRLDLAAIGSDRTLHVYQNNGNGTFTNLTVTGVNASLAAGQSNYILAWGDVNNDGWLDIAMMGATAAAARSVWVYQNNGNGTYTKVDVAGVGAGLTAGSISWGDYDNDGIPDLAVMGQDTSIKRRVWVYRNNGDLTFTKLDIGGAGGLFSGSVIWGDYNGDGALDLAINGYNDSGTYGLSIYKNMYAALGVPNTVPAAPSTLAGSFDFTSASVSTAVFKWNPGTDSGTGATNATTLNYELRVATVSSFSPTTLMPGLAATPLMGNYLRPPKIYDGNSNHGIFLVSTQPWVHTSSYGLQTDTTYYYQVRTIDAGLLPSAWSSSQSLYTGVAPSAITDLVVSSTTAEDRVYLTWTAPGNDQNKGTISSGTYRVYYSTVSSDMAGLIATTAPTATLNRVDIATSSVNPGATQAYALTGLAWGNTYYIRLLTGDQVPNWSDISNGATVSTLISTHWTGSVDTDWFTAANWNPPAVPTSSETAVILSAANEPILTAGVTVSRLQLQAGSSLTLAGFSLTLSSFTNSGHLIMNGTEMVTTAPDNMLGSTVAYRPSSTALLLSTWTYSSLIMESPGGTFVPTGDITLNENWALVAGTFDAGTSTVTFTGAAGSSSTLTGSTTFYNLHMMTPGKFVHFQAGSTITVTNELRLVGASGSPIGLRSTIDGQYAYLTVSGTSTIAFVDTRDSNAAGGQTLRAGTSSMDSGHIVNWTFGETAPASSIATVYLSSMSVSWSTVSYTTGYTVEASTASDFSGTRMSSITIDSLSTILSPQSLALNTTYFVRVGALYNGTTTYANTTPASTSTLTSLLTGMQIAQVYSGSITVHWLAFVSGSGPDTGVGYRLEASTASDFSGTIYSSVTTNIALSTLTVAGLTNATPYYLRAGALNWNEVPNYAFVGSTVTSSTGYAPHRPERILGTSNPSGTQITLAWRAVTKDVRGQPISIDHYVVERSNTLLGTPTQTTNIPASQLSWTDANNGVTYYYDVKAVSTGGVASGPSDYIDSSSDVNRIVVASDDPATRLLIPRDIALELMASSNSVGADLLIDPVRRTQDEVGSVLRSYDFQVHAIDSGVQISYFSFSQPIASLQVGYPASASGAATHSRAPPVGSASPSTSSQGLSLYWFNGQGYVPLSSAVLLPGPSAGTQVRSLGIYQVRQGVPSTSTSLLNRAPYPRVLTPNIPNQNNRVFFFLNVASDVSITGTIYDLYGAKVRDLQIDENSPSSNCLVWDAKDGGGNVVPSGIYIYSITAEGQSVTGTVVVAR